MPSTVEEASKIDNECEASAPAPTAWAEAEARAAMLIRRATGAGLAEHLLAELTARPGVQTLVLGASAAGVALELARHAPDAGLVCVEGRPELLSPSQQRARELALNVRFAELDVDALEPEAGGFDLVFCHAYLHRVIELEAAIDRIGRALRPGGALVIVEVVTGRGYSMRPETREVARAIWQTLPRKFRLNHSAYATPLIDDRIWEPETGPQVSHPRDTEIVAALDRRFVTEHFVPYFTLSRRFFDSTYGPNYNLAAPLDKAIFNWIWELDLHYLATKQLRPETFFGVYRAA